MITISADTLEELAVEAQKFLESFQGNCVTESSNETVFNEKDLANVPLYKRLGVQDPSSLRGVKIEYLNLSARAYNCLKRAGIGRVDRLLKYSEEDLLSVTSNFGEKTLRDVEIALCIYCDCPIPTNLLQDRLAPDDVIETLDLPTGACEILRDYGQIRTIGELMRFTEEELLALPGFGITSLGKIEYALLSRGLSLSGK